ncbi:hypothetical protein IWZ01DRAFT_229427 [Phyllosticta capitalensis]
MSAFQRVFDCFELAEHILLFVHEEYLFDGSDYEGGNVRTLLMAQSVCRHWRDIIQNSKRIQRHLYFLPDYESAYKTSLHGVEVNTTVPWEDGKYHGLCNGVVYLAPDWNDLCYWVRRRELQSWSKMLVSKPPKPYSVITMVGSIPVDDYMWVSGPNNHVCEPLDGTVPLGEALLKCYNMAHRALAEVPTMPWNSGSNDDAVVMACACGAVTDTFDNQLMDKTGVCGSEDEESSSTGSES